MYAMVVDKHALHFEICLFTGGLVFVFDECVLETIACAFVADYFAGQDLAETAEYQLEVLVW